MLWTVQSKCPCAPFFPIALAAAERGLGFLDSITPFIILQSPLVCQVLLADLPATSGALCHTRKQPGGEDASGDPRPYSICGLPWRCIAARVAVEKAYMPQPAVTHSPHH